MRVLSIDPGYERVGIAVIEMVEKSKNGGKKEILIYSNCFKTPAEQDFNQRLTSIGKEVENIIQKYKPKVFAIEKLYWGSNQKTAMRVSEVRGMLLFIASSNDLAIYEYTPLQIKNAVTGDGRGDKKQVIAMLSHLIDIDKIIKYDDEYDAIAIGLTCFASERNMGT